MKRPVTIRGVEYASHGEAARAIGVSQQAVTRAVRSGTENNVGMRKKSNGLLGVLLRGMEMQQAKYKPQNVISDELLEKMSDGRWRTRNDIANAIGVAPSDVEPVARALVRQGFLHSEEAKAVSTTMYQMRRKAT